MAADDPMMRVRLPPELKARLVEAARSNNRSINAEIVQRLEVSFAEKAVVTEERLVAMYEELKRIIHADVQRERGE